ncbi:hypothetical protein [Cohaesibacter celericrescens]|uniref:hypothetical protein n=1 Tax=Cohaesibacter celericrescens TaxID=2067669 RepID=UPI00356B1E21
MPKKSQSEIITDGQDPIAMQAAPRGQSSAPDETFYQRSNYLSVEWVRDVVRRAYLLNHSKSDFEYLKHIKTSAQYYADEYDMPQNFVRDARLMAEDKLFKQRLQQMIDVEGAEYERLFAERAAQSKTRKEKEDLLEVLLSPEAWRRANL